MAGSSRAQHLGDAAALILVLAVAAAIGAWVVTGGRPVGLFSDSIAYLIYADFYRGLLTGEVPPPFVVDAYRTSRYPPLYPLLLALFDAGADQPARALAVTNGVAVLAAAAVWLWLRRELAQPWAAAAGALAVILAPAWILWLLNPVSEPLMALLTVGVCCLATERGSESRVLAIAALIAIMPLARSASVTFVAAGLLWLWRRRELPVRTRGIATALMVAPAAAWMAYRALALDAESYAAAVVGPGALLSIDAVGPWLVHEMRRVVEGVGLLWLMGQGPWAIATGVALLALGAIGVAVRLRRNTLDAGYLPAYLALVLVWPYPAETERLLVVAIPFLVVAGIEGARVLGARFAARAPGAIAVLLLACAAPTLAQFLARATTPVDEALAGYQREHIYLTEPSDAWAQKIPEVYLRLQKTIEALPTLVPPGHCVYATSPMVVRYWARVPAFRYPDRLADAAQAHRDLTRCDYFLVDSTTTPQSGTPVLYPLEQLRGWTQWVSANFLEFRGERRIAAVVLKRVPDAVPAD